jgi:hypothetical protein
MDENGWRESSRKSYYSKVISGTIDGEEKYVTWPDKSGTLPCSEAK